MPRTEVHTIKDRPDRWLLRSTVRNIPIMNLLANTRAVRTNTGVAEWTIPATAETARQLRTSIPEARWKKEAARRRRLELGIRKKRIEYKDFDIEPIEWPLGDIELAPFQVCGVEWLRWGSGILADDMGLGKTVEMSVALQRIANHRKIETLVLCPTSAIGVWEDHLRRLTDIEPFIYHGPQRRRVMDRYAAWEGSKALISVHGLLTKHSDMVHYGSTPKEGTPGEFNRSWDVTILDEAHRIGVTPDGKQVRAAMSIADTSEIVWPSTGTPVNDHPRDMWVLMRYVNPLVFGSYDDFCRRYCIEVQGKHRTQNIGLHPDLEDEYEWMLKPWMLRRLKTQYAKDIPQGREPKLIQLDLTGPQRTKYREVTDLNMTKFETAEGEKTLATFAGTLVKSGPLQYLASGIPIVDDEGHITSIDTKNSNKLAYILEVARERAGDPFVVYTFSAREAEMYAEGLSNKDYKVATLTGKTGRTKRDATVAMFQRGGLDVLVVTDAGGDSITLTAADLIILARPSWRPQANKQVMDRINRWGQEREPMVEILVSVGTVDETRLAALSGKISIQEEMTLDKKRYKDLLTGKV